MTPVQASKETARARRTMVLRAAAVSCAALLAAGCTTGGFGSSKSEGTTSSSSGSVPFSDRISSLFGRSAQQESSRAPTTPATEEFDCPRIDIRAGASTLLVNAGQPSEEGNALALRYQGTFIRAARECRVTGNMVNIRIGIEGRVILGPAGAPGQVRFPLRYALVDRRSLNTSKPIWSKLQIINVEIPPQTANVNFTHIADDLTVPIPPAAELENWVIYIGFDPNRRAASAAAAGKAGRAATSDAGSAVEPPVIPDAAKRRFGIQTNIFF